MRVTYCRAELTVNSEVYVWSDDKVKTAQIMEEVDPSCQELSINEATVCVLDEAKEFDITNPDGTWNDLEYDQQLDLFEYIDGAKVSCGTYYLDGWKYADNLATFTAVDAIGYIARRTFPGAFYQDKAASSILSDIMGYGEYYDYSIDSDLASITLTGYLPSSDCREALRCLCLAIGAVADCRRSSTISVTAVQKSHSASIGTDRKFYGNTSAELDEAVATVSFSVPIYTAGTESETLFSAELPAGTHVLTLDPFVEDSVEITEGSDAVSLFAIGKCRVTVKLKSSSTITITGIKYTATTTTFSVTTEVENFADYPASKSYTCPLYNLSYMQTVMTSLLEYWQLRKSVKIKYLLEDEIAGDWINIVDEDSQASTLRIENQTIDLAGGFIAVTEAKGYTSDEFDALFSGTDGDDDDDDGGDTGSGTDGGTDGGDDSGDGTDDGDDSGDGTDDGDDSGDTGTDTDDDTDTSTLSLGVYCDEVEETTDGVNFYDNAGRCVYSYSWDEVEAMTKLPDLPMFYVTEDMEEYGFDDLFPTMYPEGWNWDLSSIQGAHHTDTDSAEILDVGCCYYTNEEKTVYLFFAETDEVTLYFSKAGATIDWGDGSDTETATSGEVSHTYDAAGSYRVKLSGGYIYLGSTSSSYGTTAYSGIHAGTLKYAILPGDVTLNSYAFSLCSDLVGAYMTLDRSLPVGLFLRCTSLTNITMGTGVSYPTRQAFAYCSSLKQALFSSETGAGEYANYSVTMNGNSITPFYGCSKLTRLSLDMNSLAATFGNVAADEIYLYGSPSSSGEVSFTQSGVEKISGLKWVKAAPDDGIWTNGKSYCLYTSITDLVNIQGIYADINMGYCSSLTYDSAVRVLNALSSDSTGTVTFSETTYNLLSEDDLAIATDKGWTVTYA